MRDIKFRAWDDRSKQMFYDRFVIYPDTSACHFPEGGWDLNGDPEDSRFFHLMQFTGLQDRNGKDIYEGDILTDKWKAEVYFKNGSFWISSKPSINADSYLHGFIKSREQAKCPVEIIGNIHENPELLEQS